MNEWIRQVVSQRRELVGKRHLVVTRCHLHLLHLHVTWSFGFRFYIFVLLDKLSEIVIIFNLLLLQRYYSVDVAGEVLQLLHQLSLFDHECLDRIGVYS